MGASFDAAAPGRRRQRSPAQLAMIRRTVARALTEAEFDAFLEVADAAELDPLRRQIVPLVTAPEDKERRGVIPWTTIDGLRVIAARAGDYRPMEEAPLLEIDVARADPATNPLGLVRAEVRVWKRSGETWHPVTGEAWWDEYAPVSRRLVRAEDGTSASVIELDPAWRRMARLMLTKCAEAQALRRGWPDLLSGLYSEDELHRVQRDAASSVAVAGAGAGRSGGGGADAAAGAACFGPSPRMYGAESAYLLALNIGGPLESVACAQLPDRLAALYRDAKSVDEIDALEAINRATLQAFWSRAPADAITLKRVAEARRTELSHVVASKPRAETTTSEASGRLREHVVVDPSADRKQNNGRVRSGRSGRQRGGEAGGGSK